MSAERTLGGLRALAWGCLGGGGALAACAWIAADPDLRAWSALGSAALLVAAAGALPAWLMASARAEARRRSARPADAGRWGDDLPPAPDPALALRDRAGTPQALAVGLCAAAALALPLWQRPGGGGGTAELVPALVALAAIFPLLVVERLLAAQDRDSLPERDGLVRLLRVPVAVCILAGLSLLAASMGWAGAWHLQWIALALVAVVAVELLLRAAVHAVAPGEGRPCADSVVAGALLARIDPVSAVVQGLRERFGIDLARSWSARLIGAALPWVAAGALAAGWLLTGISAVPLGTRVVLQDAAGARVLGPGTHLHAPWPFAVRRSIDDGRLRETLLGELDAPLPRIAAQDVPPAAYDRLWDAVHPAESTFLSPAPATAGTGQGFKVLSSDVRVLWRIGGEDADALAAVGRLADAEALLARAARRAMTACCAERPLDQLLASDRDGLGSALRRDLQVELDRLAGGRSGLAVAAVVIDAIHPPVGAAPAYHRVQAAGIDAQAQVAKARAEAQRLVSTAAIDAMQRAAAAAASAAESTSAAHAAAVRFAADREAWTTHRDGMALERWLAAIRAGVGRNPVTIIDHRLDPGEATVLQFGPTVPAGRP